VYFSFCEFHTIMTAVACSYLAGQPPVDPAQEPIS